MSGDHPAARMGAQQAFLPVKALPHNGYTYEQGTRGFCARIANYMLDQLGPLTSTTVLLDNGCGAGACTRAVMARNPPSGIKIHAADISPGMTGPLEEAIRTHGWPVEVAHMPAQQLGFADATFTLSLSSLVVQYTPNDGVDACRELHRTLKPGGRTVVNCFAAVPHWQPFSDTYAAVKSAPFPFPAGSMEAWFSGEKLKNALVAAGFDEGKVVMTRFDAPIKLKEAQGDWKELATFTWSTIGGLAGWTKEDEDRWDEAIDMLAKKLSEMPEVESDGEGGLQYVVPMHVAVATK